MIDSQMVPKFFTAFVLIMKDAVSGKLLQLHCTHKYLGVISPLEFQKVAGICDDYFSQERIFPLAIFNKPDLFGPAENIPVLKSFIHADNFFPDLKLQLDGFLQDEFPVYQPHITVKGFSDTSVNGSFNCYAIMSGSRVMKYWENKKCLAQKKKQKPKTESSSQPTVSGP